MSFALSSIGRARQKKLFFPLVIFILLLFVPLSPPSGVQASESLTNSAASPNSVGSAASEFENIDSFDIHPVNRWVIANNDYTATTDNSILNMSDVGDGTQDTYRLDRGLRDLDGTIEIRFKTDTNATSTDAGTSFSIDLGSAFNTGFKFNSYTLKDNDYASYYVRYYTKAGNEALIFTSGDTRLYDNVWYRIRIDYSLLESDLRIRCYFDNGSKVFDYEWQDIDPNEDPLLFADTDLLLMIQVGSITDKHFLKQYIDYINAPFKEREWKHTTIGSDTDWLVDESWESVIAQDDIIDSHIWQLIVPELDQVTGMLHIECTDISASATDDFWTTIRVDCVDADDGGTHIAFAWTLGWENGDATAILNVDAVEKYRYTNATDINKMWMNFGLTTRDDRSILSGYIRIGWDTSRPDLFDEYFDDIPVSSIATDPSQEFIVTIAHYAEFTADVEYKAWIEDFTVIHDMIFANPSPNFLAPGGYYEEAMEAAAFDPFGILQGIGEVLTTIFGPILNPISDFIKDLIAGVQGIAASIWSGIGTALDFIVNAINGLWTALIAILDDIIAQLLILAEDAADLIFAIIEFIVVLLLDIVEALWAVLEATIFFVWDALNLPDMIEIFDLILVYIVELVQWLVVTIQDVIQLAADLSWVILVGWWIWALPIQWGRAEGNPLGGLGNFIEVFFYDLIPWSFLGIHVYVPQGIAATLWMIFLLPADFALFTALGI